MLQTTIGDALPSATSSGSAEPLSPGLANRDLGAAFELKYHLTAAEADFVEAWAYRNLTPDTHATQGHYRVTSVYCDTLAFDVFHRNAGFKRRKYRVRRYGDSAHLFLERKTKNGDQVRKKRVEIVGHDVGRLAETAVDPDWAGAWFHRLLVKHAFAPACRISYERTAFFGMAGEAPVRLTIDRNLIGEATRDWHVGAVKHGIPLLPGSALLEMKFHLHMPALFHDLLPHLPAQPARVSKYRKCVHLCGLAEPVILPGPAENRSVAG